jgi:hypothetical protein
MQFFTKVPISKASKPINYESKIVSLGACFAENISEKLRFFQFKNIVNPFGIIFNSISIEKLIRRVVQRHFFSENDIFFHNERWHCFDVHSYVSHPDKDLFLKQLNTTLDLFSKDILVASHLIITLGTSWVYKTIASNDVVANCHKIPQKQFSKHLLSIVEITSSLNNIVRLINQINPNCHFIFTISPVRHIKDGFVENQISKANLISAVYDITNNQNIVLNLSYFPSYEIMMDELRDYRFYKQDLLHPNQTAVDYIWSKFIETQVEKSALSTMNEVEIIQKGLQHRSFNPASVAHEKFTEDLDVKIRRLQNIHPFIKF